MSGGGGQGTWFGGGGGGEALSITQFNPVSQGDGGCVSSEQLSLIIIKITKSDKI